MANEESDYGTQKQRGMTPIRVTLTANVPQRFMINGDWIHCFQSPDGVTDLTARFDNGEKVPLPQGLGFRRYYREIELESATGGAFIVLLGFGSVFDGRATVAGVFNVTVSPGANIDDGGDVATVSGAATLLLALDANRMYAVICNPSTNTATVRIGSATVNAAKGIPLEPGETLHYAMQGAIYAYQASGGAVTISAAAVKE